MEKIYKIFLYFFFGFYLHLSFSFGTAMGQGSNAFGPATGETKPSQNASNNQDNPDKPKKNKSNTKKDLSEENDFSIEDDFGEAGGGDSFPMSPTQNETGDEFFTNDTSSASGSDNKTPKTQPSAFGTTSGNPANTGSNPGVEQISPTVTPAPQNTLPANSPPLPTNIPNASPPPIAPPPIAPPPTPAPTPPPPATTTTQQVVIPDPTTKPQPIANDFAGSPALPGTMRQMADGEAPETYVVQKGDTLFDICDQLLDEKSYWPKLWSMNPYIRNPHFIFPSMKLRFYPGDQDTPPYLQVVSEDDVIPIDKGNLDEKQLVEDSAPESISPINQPATKSNPEIEVVGPDQLAGELSDLFMMGGRRYNGTEITVEVPGFIFPEAREPKAYVIGGRYGEMSLGPGQMATIEGTGELSSGNLLTVIREGPDIYDPVTGDFVGYLYYFVGNISVANKIEDEIYSAEVQSTRLSVRPDDLVVEYISTSRTIPSNTIGVPTSEVDASIVAYEYDNQLLGAEGQSVFIDKGSQDGVAPGMYLSVYQTPRLLSGEFSSEDLPEDYHRVGLIRIIDVTTHGAVGYVLESSRELKVDDRTRNPNR